MGSLKKMMPELRLEVFTTDEKCVPGKGNRLCKGEAAWNLRYDEERNAKGGRYVENQQGGPDQGGIWIGHKEEAFSNNQSSPILNSVFVLRAHSCTPLPRATSGTQQEPKICLSGLPKGFQKSQRI